MSFVATFYANLTAAPDRVVLGEVRGDALVPCTGRELQRQVAVVRGLLRARGVERGDRVVLLAPNSIRWVAVDLAMLGEAAIAVPMYARQDPEELVGMMHDCRPRLVIAATAELADAVRAHWPEAPLATFDEVFDAGAPHATAVPLDEAPLDRPDAEDCTIIYTSGSTGVPKGVVTSVGNTAFMLNTTCDALLGMTGRPAGSDRVFHYLPFCFAGSRIMLWSQLLRSNPIWVSTDLNDLVRELGAAQPHYYLNVPALLERVKNGVEKNVSEQSAPVTWLWNQGKRAWHAKREGTATLAQRALLRLAKAVVFRRIRDRIGAKLECLICGSAPLGEDTQRWFEMLDIPVYQIYGLTETTAIVTIDRPGDVVPGRVGPAIPGVEVKLGEHDELLTRGPHVFQRYWDKPEATDEAFVDGWFRTGDQAEVDDGGRWRIIGRVKNLLVPTSGHNVAPEPIEQTIVERIDGVEQCLLVGHARPFLTAIVTGEVSEAAVKAGIEAVNAELPHYRKIRRWHVSGEPFSIENGLLTANSKVRRAAIEAAYADAIEAMYT